MDNFFLLFSWHQLHVSNCVQRIFSKSCPVKEPSRKVSPCAPLWVIYDRPRVRVQQVGATSFHTGLRFMCVCVCTHERTQNHPVCHTRIEGYRRFCLRTMVIIIIFIRVRNLKYLYFFSTVFLYDVCIFCKYVMQNSMVSISCVFFR